MTIIAGSGNLGTGVWLTHNSDSNRFINLDIKTSTTATTANVNGVIFSGSATAINMTGSTGNYNLFDSLYVEGGYRGVYIVAPTTMSKGNIVRNSTFFSQTYSGIYYYNQERPVIFNNKISGLRNGTHFGLYLYNSSNIEVISNQVYASNFGLYVNFANTNLYDAGFTSRVSNNIASSNAYVAMNVIGSSNLLIQHNTIRGNTTTNGAAWIASSTRLDFRNNIIRNDNSGGYTLWTDTINNFSELNGNNYSPALGGKFVYLDGEYTSLGNLQSAFTQFNKTAYSVLPAFVAASNLRLGALSYAPRGVAINVSADIDGNTRNTFAPTIGASEVGTRAAVNAAPARIFTNDAYFCTGTHVVKAEIANSGTTLLNSVQVNWSVNGVLQSPVNVSNAIDTVNSINGNQLAVTLGNVNFPNSGYTAIKVWTGQPNGVADQDNSDDSLTTAIHTRLNGEYSIGAAGNFTSFTQALTMLNSHGVCGPVVFKVDPGTYTERLVLTGIVGASATNTITFKGSGIGQTTLTNTATGNANWSTILLNGADYFTFRDMSISS